MLGQPKFNYSMYGSAQITKKITRSVRQAMDSKNDLDRAYGSDYPLFYRRLHSTEIMK